MEVKTKIEEDKIDENEEVNEELDVEEDLSYL